MFTLSVPYFALNINHISLYISFNCMSRIHDDNLSLQTISLLVYMSGALGKKGPFLVLSPLSVMENWRKELEGYDHIHI